MSNIIELPALRVIKCDHAEKGVPCCSACFHQTVYNVCREAGFKESLSDQIADNAMNEAVMNGQFEPK